MKNKRRYITRPEFIPFNDGICTIYSVENSAGDGDMPVEQLILKYKLRFRWHTVGMSRYYEAMQAQVKISNAVDVPLRVDVNAQDVAVINDRQYRIIQKQEKRDTKPASMLLTLTDIEEAFEL